MLRPYTLSIDDALMQAAKMRALKEGTSVSEIVRRLLSEYLGFTEDAQQKGRSSEEIQATLERYSAGELRRCEAMRSIDLDVSDIDRFNALMADYSIPWPTQSPERIDQQANIVANIIAAAKGAER